MPAGRLFVVSTPIGNLGDITHRAVETLGAVSLILAEDTRHSRALLERYGVRTPVAALHEHNEAAATAGALARLAAGDDLALISDAGTPLLSDPGARLVAGAVGAGIAVVPVPGASALLAALVASGLDATRFTFAGFLPRAGGARRHAVAELLALPHTVVLYEAPSRVARTLVELADAGAGARPAAVARELTKRFEELRRGTVAELARYYLAEPPRGEVVLVLAGAPPPEVDEAALREHARALRAAGHGPRETARRLVAEHGAPRNLAYRLAHAV